MEATISILDAEILSVIPAWLESGQGVDAHLGMPKPEAYSLADDLRRALRSTKAGKPDLNNQDEAADTLHALCAFLSEECAGRPESVLEEAESIGRIVVSLEWASDDMGERASLLRSLAFTAWRASRILCLPQRAQTWESEYRRIFRGSLLWEVAESICQSQTGSDEAFEGIDWNDAEGVFQILLYLEDQRDADPKGTSAIAERVYRSLHGLRLPRDVHAFLLAEAALIVGGTLRQVAQPHAVERWSELAESHLREDPNPRPSLARIAFLRLASLYEQSRYDLAARGAPALERSFADLGMEEDRVKCRVLWAASLKLLGQFQEALEVLRPVRQWRSNLPASLYGWVLLHSGDLHQICGHYPLALKELEEAAHLLRAGKQFTGLADVHSMISCIYRAHGMLSEALQLLKSSCDDHARLGMKALEAANRMLIAETYLAMGRAHDAEVEIRAAMPVFEEQAMVADAVVAVNLLREAIRRQRLDPPTVSDIRDRFHPKK
jgi:tetratricopeptide (TPR) repeat protein